MKNSDRIALNEKFKAENAAHLENHEATKVKARKEWEASWETKIDPKTGKPIHVPRPKKPGIKGK